MKEIAEFRLLKKHAGRLFSLNEMRDLGSVVEVKIDTADSRFLEIGKLQETLRSQGDLFFSSWYIVRKYTKAELSAAELFHMDVLQRFEPAGEECGTLYDEAVACKLCGSDARQATPLRLKKSAIPRSRDFSRTIANVEFVVSRKAAELFKEHDVTGLKYGPVFSYRNSNTVLTDWCQLFVVNSPLEVSSRTKFGITPFDADIQGRYMCANGHKAGFNKLSELYIKNGPREAYDFVSTRQFVGQRLGLIRPTRLICISQKVRQIIEVHKLKGCHLEVANLG